MNGNFGIAAGNFMQAFLAARMAKEAKERDQKQIKLQTQLFELQLQKLKDEQAQRAKASQDVATQRRLGGINRDMIMGEAQLGVDTGQYRSVAEALADATMQSDMRRFGFDPAKDFGVQDTPADIRELEILQQRPDLAAIDQARRSASATRIDTGDRLGKIPPGFALTQGPDGSFQMAPVPGGPAAVEQASAVSKTDSAYRTNSANLDLMIQKAEALQQNPNLWLGVGIGGATAGQVPGTPGANVLADITSLVAQTSIQTLQDMRDASKTGGAVGAVSEKEWPRLEGKISALATSQSPGQFRERLGDLVTFLRESQGRMKQAYEEDRAALTTRGGLGATPPALGPRKPDATGVVDFGDL